MRVIAAAIVAGSLILSTVVLATVALAQSGSPAAPSGSTTAPPPAAATPAGPATAAAPAPVGKKLACQTGSEAMKGQARKDIEGGGVYINNLRESNISRQITAADLLFDKHLLLRKGKRNYVVLSAR